LKFLIHINLSGKWEIKKKGREIKEGRGKRSGEEKSALICLGNCNKVALWGHEPWHIKKIIAT
jgi:hypothetical protein